MAYLRKVKTASGATAVQIAVKDGRRDRVLEHLGSAHSPAELQALLQIGRQKLHQGQLSLDLGLEPNQDPAAATIETKTSQLLIEAITTAWERLGFDAVADEAFFQLVTARLVEPTSMSDAPRVLTEIGIDSAHRNTFANTLKRCARDDYRDRIAKACLTHAATSKDISLVLYDVTTLYFEAENEDELRKVGYSKERRVDPQIVVGLLVDRTGFPLEIGCFKGNTAETRTIIPIIDRFQQRHGLTGMVVVADAGMLSGSNLKELDEADLGFIVGSRQTKAPADLAGHFHWNGDAFTDGQVIDTITPRQGSAKGRDRSKRAEPVWDRQEHPHAWRAIWQYSRKRAVRDGKTLTAQENRATAIINGDKQMKSARFVKTTPAGRSLDTTALERARGLVGLKGYVTNIPAKVMSAVEVIGSYHDLWQVEQSFRMSKTDLRARPMFHHTHEAIEAHLTVVFAALAIARFLQDATGVSIKKLVRALRPLQEVTITVNGQSLTAKPRVPADTQAMLDRLAH